MNTRGCSVFGVGVSQVQKVYRQNSVFSSLIPGRRYHFVVRTEKESFTDSSPVTINITAGTHTHTHKCSHTNFYYLLHNFFYKYSSQLSGGVCSQ